MNKRDLSIATITWARNEEEENLLMTSLQHLATVEIPVFITDGGSRKQFLDFLNSFPHFTLFKAEGKGVWAQAKKSLLKAHSSGSKYIFYTEPDKRDFFEHFLPSLFKQLSFNEQTGIILASRSPLGFATFPLFQQMTETTINSCCAEIIGKGFDYTYGPFLLNRELVPYLDGLQEDMGWGWRPYIFSVAHQLGYNIEAFVDDFSCPLDQREDNGDERIYRMCQLSQNISGLVISTAKAINKSSAE